MFRAIKVTPANTLQIKIELDLVVLDMFTESTERYLVDGFMGEVVAWQMYDAERFNKEWRFILGGTGNDRFETVMARG